MCVLPAGGPNLPWAVTLAVAPRPALVLTLSPAVEGPGPRLSFGGFPWSKIHPRWLCSGPLQERSWGGTMAGMCCDGGHWPQVRLLRRS